MKRTLCVASNSTVVIGVRVVEGHLYADDLVLVHDRLRECKPQCLSDFYKALGFEHLRRYGDTVTFFDLDTELETVQYLPADLLKVLGISN